MKDNITREWKQKDSYRARNNDMRNICIEMF